MSTSADMKDTVVGLQVVTAEMSLILANMATGEDDNVELCGELGNQLDSLNQRYLVLSGQIMDVTDDDDGGGKKTAMASKSSTRNADNAWRSWHSRNGSALRKPLPVRPFKPSLVEKYKKRQAIRRSTGGKEPSAFDIWKLSDSEEETRLTDGEDAGAHPAKPDVDGGKQKATARKSCSLGAPRKQISARSGGPDKELGHDSNNSNENDVDGTKLAKKKGGGCKRKRRACRSTGGDWPGHKVSSSCAKEPKKKPTTVDLSWVASDEDGDGADKQEEHAPAKANDVLDKHEDV